MKKNISVFLIGISGGACSVGVLMLWFYFSSKKPVLGHDDKPPVHTVSFTESTNNQSYPDFTIAAEKVMDAVVHIKSIHKLEHQYRRSNPHMYTFPDDFFEQFFGSPYGNQPRQEQEQIGTGSGVIIKGNGYIVTNNHVIKDADEVHITLHDNRTFEAKIIGVDPSTDLALLKIDVSDLTFIPFANSDEVKVGQWVLAVGNPFNLNSTVTAGIVSAKGRNINILKDKYAIESFIQTDAAINPGNSGGALVNLNGELIGINTAIASPTGSYSGYGFAIPSNITKKVIGDLLEFGTVQRAFLGVSIRDVDANLAKEKGLQQTEGIYVESMQANSAARQAGIENGDVIIIADNVKVKTIPELQEIIAKHAPGDKITITVMRGNEEKSFDVILSTAHGVTQSIAKTDSDVLSRLGISITSVQPEILKKLGIAGGVRITHITNGVISNATDMKPGCIIVKVDRQQVLSNQQFIDIIKSKEGGILLECRYENQRATYYYGFGL